MDLEEAITTQRAIRRLRPDPVDDDVLLRCLRLATKAPTAQNRQTWEFVVVRDARARAALARQYQMAWRAYVPFGRLRWRRDERMRRMYDSVTRQVERFEDVPVHVVFLLRGRGIAWPRLARVSRYASILPAVQNFLLAARAEGLGATLTTLPLWNARSVRRILGLPRGIEPIALVPVGWPEGRYGPTTRRPVEEATHVDRFGNRPFLRR